jgi:GH43 family beta-xylosidase
MGGSLYLYISEDPAGIESAQCRRIFDAQGGHGLMHMWLPQIVSVNGIWCVYFTADDGNTDNHRLYVISNPSPDPLQGEFKLAGHIKTDPDDSWAIHPKVFRHNDEWYMLWSGWESMRVFAETQHIYIAKMNDIGTFASPRVKLSSPDHEWERQWVRPDGVQLFKYPIFVNEAPFFFDTDKTDKMYIFYSASANWTPYYAIGALEARKGSDILDPASWTKSERPLFRQSKRNGVYGVGQPCMIPSPDGTEYYMLYIGHRTPATDLRSVRMQKIEFSPEGKPMLGIPVGLDAALPKPSGTPKSLFKKF